MAKEIWKDIPGYPKYEVSSLGEVRRVGAKVSLKPSIEGTGNCIVTLYNDTGARHCRIMEIVAGVFLGERPDGQEIIHKNGDILDNQASNLMYGNIQEYELDALGRDIWRVIKETEGRYAISVNGDVYSFSRMVRSRHGTRLVPGSFVKPHLDIWGYLTVSMTKPNGESIWRSIHRLLATEFIPNPDNLPQVNHKDENKLNNSLDNLEWCTIDYNLAYGTRTERVAKSQRKAILAYNKDGSFYKEFDCAEEAGKDIGVCRTMIPRYIRGQKHNRKGFTFKYK